MPAEIAEARERVEEARERGDACAADRLADDLVRATIGAINAGDVPPELQEELLSEAQALVDETACAG